MSLPPAPAKVATPGRPKDLGKGAAILEAAKRLFTSQGFDGTSMDQIAAEAGVDAVIAQGVEAGGHVKATESIWDVLPRAVEAVPDHPPALDAWHSVALAKQLAAFPHVARIRTHFTLRRVSGLSQRETAEKMHISEKTVKGHLTNLFQRLGVADRTQAALWAERRWRSV